MNPVGAYTWIPFGIDALAGSYGSNGNLAASAAALNLLTLATPGGSATGDLVNLYKNCTAVTEGGVTFNPNAGGNITLYVPQVGSSTRNFFLGQLGINTSIPLPGCVHDTLQANNAPNPGITCPAIGSAVEEYDGTAVTCDPNGYMPFSVAQFIGQNNGHNARFHDALLAAVNSISPCTGGSFCGAGTSLNTGATIVRPVYNVVLYNSVTSGAPGYDPTLAQLIAGTSSLLCRDAPTIISYGFGRLPGPTGLTCGSTAIRTN